MFKTEAYDRIKVRDLMQQTPLELDINQTLDEIKVSFDSRSDLWNIPVTQQNRYVGFISKGSFLNKYKNLMEELLHNSDN